jgi:hypothetical protein
MVSRAEFRAALDAAKVPTLALMGLGPTRSVPTVQVSKTAGPELSFVQDWTGRLARLFGFPHLAPVSAAARSAVAAARDSLEHRLARALQSARVLEGESLDQCIAGMHAILDGHGYPKHDRFVAFPAASWTRLMADNPSWLSTHEVWPGAILVAHKGLGDMIWLRSRHLEEVQAVMFHKAAIEGCINPLNPSPGQSASAEVKVRVIEPEGLRVLRWPARN